MTGCGLRTSADLRQRELGSGTAGTGGIGAATHTWVSLAECSSGQCDCVPGVYGRSLSAAVVVARESVGPDRCHGPAVASQLRLPAVGCVPSRRVRRCDGCASGATWCDRPRSGVPGLHSEGVGAAQLRRGSRRSRNRGRSWGSRTAGPGDTRGAGSHHNKDGRATKHPYDIHVSPNVAVRCR
jgi:hypothetical protein